MTGSAFVVTHDAAGNVLAVSRGPGGWVWGLPGGRQEPNELLVQTAVREMQEETGLRAYTPPYPILMRNNRAIFGVRDTIGHLRGSHEGDAAFVPWGFLIERGGRWARLHARLAAAQ